jgi:hypothetical protein
MVGGRVAVGLPLSAPARTDAGEHRGDLALAARLRPAQRKSGGALRDRRRSCRNLGQGRGLDGSRRARADYRVRSLRSSSWCGGGPRRRGRSGDHVQGRGSPARSGCRRPGGSLERRNDGACCLADHREQRQRPPLHAPSGEDEQRQPDRRRRCQSSDCGLRDVDNGRRHGVCVPRCGPPAQGELSRSNIAWKALILHCLRRSSRPAARPKARRPRTASVRRGDRPLRPQLGAMRTRARGNLDVLDRSHAGQE